MARTREHARGARDLVQDIGGAIALLDRAIDRLAEDDIRIYSWTVKTHYAGRDDWLAVVRAEAGQNKLVAFHSAETGWELIMGLANRINNKSLKWGEDEYA